MDFLQNEKPTGIINIVDAPDIKRNLYLYQQRWNWNPNGAGAKYDG